MGKGGAWRCGRGGCHVEQPHIRIFRRLRAPLLSDHRVACFPNWVRMANFSSGPRRVSRNCQGRGRRRHRGRRRRPTRMREAAKGAVRHSVSLRNLVSGFSGVFVLHACRIIELRDFQIGFGCRIFLLECNECRETAEGCKEEDDEAAPARGAAQGGERRSVSLRNLVSGFSGAFVLHACRIIELRDFQIGFASRIFLLECNECRETADEYKVAGDVAAPARGAAPGGEQRGDGGGKGHYICIARMRLVVKVGRRAGETQGQL